MNAVNPRVSFAELQNWPDPERYVRYELYDGEVIVVAMPIPRHRRVAMHVGEVLHGYEKGSGGLVFDSPIDIVFSEYDVVQPDVTFFRTCTLEGVYGEHDQVVSPTLPGLSFNASTIFEE